DADSEHLAIFGDVVGIADGRVTLRSFGAEKELTIKLTGSTHGRNELAIGASIFVGASRANGELTASVIAPLGRGDWVKPGPIAPSAMKISNVEQNQQSSGSWCLGNNSFQPGPNTLDFFNCIGGP